MHPFYIQLIILTVLYVITTFIQFADFDPRTLEINHYAFLIISSIHALNLIAYSIHEEVIYVGVIATIMYVYNFQLSVKEINKVRVGNMTNLLTLLSDPQPTQSILKSINENDGKYELVFKKPIVVDDYYTHDLYNSIQAFKEHWSNENISASLVRVSERSFHSIIFKENT